MHLLLGQVPLYNSNRNSRIQPIAQSIETRIQAEHSRVREELRSSIKGKGHGSRCASPSADLGRVDLTSLESHRIPSEQHVIMECYRRQWTWHRSAKLLTILCRTPQPGPPRPFDMWPSLPFSSLSFWPALSYPLFPTWVDVLALPVPLFIMLPLPHLS